MMDIDEFLEREASLISEEPGEIKKEAREKDENERAKTKEIKNVRAVLEGIKTPADNKNLDGIEKSYTELWEKLQSSDFLWNENFYNSITSFISAINDGLIKLNNEFYNKQREMQALFDKCRLNISKGNYDEALSIYSELNRINSEIPDTLTDKKIPLQNKILDLYKELGTSKLQSTTQLSGLLLRQIYSLMAQANRNLENSETNAAKSVFVNILELYNKLPKGMLEIKAAIGSKLIDLYKEISINLEIEYLEKQLGKPHYKAAPQIGPLKDTGYFTRGEKSAFKTEVPLKDAYMPRIKPKESYSLPEISIKKTEPHERLKSILIKNKLSRAKANIENGNYHKAQRDIDSILKLDKYNIEAKNLKEKIKNILETKQNEQQKPLKEIKEIHKEVHIKEEAKHAKERFEQNKEIYKGKKIIEEINPKTKEILIENRLERAKLKFEKGQFKEAKKDVEDILKLDKNNIEANNLFDKLKNLDELYKQKHEKDIKHKAHEKQSFVPYVAKPEIKKLPTSTSDSELKNLLIKSKLERAKLNLEKKDNKHAKQDLEAVLRLDKDNEEAKQMLSKIV